MTNRDSETVEIALAELRLLSDFIRGQEEVRLKIRGWNLALISGLTVAQASSDLSLGTSAYVLLGLGIVATGWFLEAWHAMAQFGGILRNYEVEEFLQGASDHYDGPALSSSMRRYGHHDVWFRFLPEGLKYGRIALPNLVMAGVIVIVGWSA